MDVVVSTDITGGNAPKLDLREYFGTAASGSQDFIRAFYKALAGATSPRTQELFEEWRQVFSHVCAYAPGKMEGLTKYYKIEDNPTEKVKNARKEQSGESVDVEKLMFTVHTFYSVLVKLITAEILLTGTKKMQHGSYLESLEKACTKDPRELEKDMADLEEDAPFKEAGILNFGEVDYFKWYLGEWNLEIATALSTIIQALRQYSFARIPVNPENGRDLFKQLYQDIVPPTVRHDLGEFFTPDWLAELVLDEIGYDGDGTKSILDPACGSGTFIVQTIKRFQKYADDHHIAENSRLTTILKNIQGLDLNPLAVLASKANYLIQIANLLKAFPVEGFEIPVFLTDVINGNGGVNAHKAPFLEDDFDFVCGNPPWVNWENLPSDYREKTKNLWSEYLLVPKSHGMGLGKTKRDLAMLFTARCLDRYVKKGGRYGFIIPYTCFKSQAGSGFRKFLASGRLQTERMVNGVQEDHIPINVQNVHDLVELYPFEGAITRTAMLVIEKAGTTIFPIPCTIWQNRGSQGIPVDLLLTQVKCHTTRVPMLLAPIDIENCETPWMVGTRESFAALHPMLKKPHLTSNPGSRPYYKYHAHAGVVTLFNQIYWIEVRTNEQGNFEVPNPILPEKRNCIKITNPMRPGQKKSTNVITHVMEKDLVYPLIRGKEVKRWYCNSDLGYILLPVDASGQCFSHEQLRARYPNCYDYFSGFFNELINRNGQPYKNKLRPFRKLDFEKAEKVSPPFYWLFNVAPALTPFKVVWKYIAGKITGKARLSAAVIEPIKNELFTNTTVVPNEKLMIVEVTSLEEAHYIASVLNSTFCRLLVASYVIETAISTHILNEINIPQFEPKNHLHHHLATLSKWMHAMAKQIYEHDRPDLVKSVMELENAVDMVTAKVYGISENALKDVKIAFRKVFGDQLEEGGAGDEKTKKTEIGAEIENGTPVC